MRSYALLVLLGCALVVEEARAQYWGSSGDEFCLEENCYESMELWAVYISLTALAFSFGCGS